MRVVLSVIVAIILLCLTFLLFIRKEHTYNASAKVHVAQTKDGFRLIRNGEPFEIRGASGEEAYLDKLHEMGGNTIRFYDTINFNKKLDSAQKYGIAVIADIPIPAYRKEYNPYESAFKRARYQSLVKDFVSKYKDHPALLMWVLGNEINFPVSSNGDGFTTYYKSLIEMVKEIDPDHPVTTAIPQSGRHLILKLWYTTKLDLIAINTFGGIKEIEKDFRQINFLWNGPYLITEWNDEGPWTEIMTKWGAPIEPTSSKKAERLAAVYDQHIRPLHGRNLGSLIFYWGTKHERTHTWFSLFEESGEITPSVYAMQSIFKQQEESNYDGPEMYYMMLNRYGAEESMILTQGQINTADVFFNASNCDSISIQWEILPEVWNNQKRLKRKEIKPSSLNHLILENKDNMIRFKTPEEEGPYRIFCVIRDNKGNVARTNFPFYVINQMNAQK
ncbi:glycoside hydrolase family 2 TIM barrel-domain containing protein [Robertkochia marina]|nr:glycoside hydrolase family 2 TIM barrel-domain containing protein [Robertkochia marina]